MLRADGLDEFTKARHEDQEEAEGENADQRSGQDIGVRRRPGVDEVQRHFDDERGRGGEAGESGETSCE
jgi:hypothetical protein